MPRVTKQRPRSLLLNELHVTNITIIKNRGSLSKETRIRVQYVCVYARAS